MLRLCEGRGVFEIPRYQAEELFSAPFRAAITPAMVIKNIDRLIAGEPQKAEAVSRRQAVIDDLLARANRAAREARRVATTLVAIFF